MSNDMIDIIINKQEKYKYGFTSDISSYSLDPGINKNIIKEISKRKKEPEFLLQWRLKAYEYWKNMKEPTWGNLSYKPINYNDIIYYSEPKIQKHNSLKEIDPKILEVYDKLGISLNEQKRLSGVAVDAIFDSVSVATTFKEELLEYGIIFCSFSEAVKKYPILIQKYLGSVVSYKDNFFASLNSAIFSDGSFCYIPKNTKCPLDLSTYFRINAMLTGQFERTLIIAEKNSYVNYLEGCTAPIRNENQLHAAVVEIIALENATINYSTVQNWYPGDKYGNGGIYNFVTKRGICKQKKSKITWTQIEVGSSITWKYPSVILKGDKSSGEFHSISVTKNKQQADTGTKMIHIGKNTKSTIIAKSIVTGESKNTYRGIVKINKQSNYSNNYTQCDSLLLSNKCISNTFPKIESHNHFSTIQHEATTNKINEEQLFYCMQRGLKKEHAITIIANGFCKTIFKKLPSEFAIESQKLLDITLENNI